MQLFCMYQKLLAISYNSCKIPGQTMREQTKATDILRDQMKTTENFLDQKISRPCKLRGRIRHYSLQNEKYDSLMQFASDI